MKCLEILLEVDKMLCQLWGVSSPWFANKKYSYIYKMYVFILYSSLVVALILLSSKELFIISSVQLFLHRIGNVMLICETLMNVYFFGIRKKIVDKFIHAFRTNESKLTTYFRDIADSGFRYRFFKTVLLILPMLAALLTRVYILCFDFSWKYLTTVVRYVIALSVTLQWSVCMESLELDLSKVRKLLKSAVDCDVLDTAVRGYRTVVDNYRITADHFGVYNLYSTCLLVLRAVKNPYLIWLCCVTKKAHLYEFCDAQLSVIVSMTIFDCIAFVVKAVICSQVESKVRLSLSLYT